MRTATQRRAMVWIPVAAILIAGFLLWMTRGGDDVLVPEDAPASSGTRTITSNASVLPAWSIDYPNTWHAASSELMPNLGWESLTLASFPIRAGGSRCAHIPENALRDLEAQDALISVFLNARLGAEGTVWPHGGFNDQVFPESTSGTDAHECAGRPDLEVHWGLFSLGGRGHYALVVFGAEASTDTRAQAWTILSSLSPHT